MIISRFTIHSDLDIIKYDTAAAAAAATAFYL
jgi:hypothetical protein